MKNIYIKNISRIAGMAVMAMVVAVLYSCSSGESEERPAAMADSVANQEVIKLGIIPLTDCAPLVIAFEKGLFKKYGVNVELSKEASWANVRDKLLTGELQGAHCLFGMPFSVYTGVGGSAGSEMHIAMLLNNNGQCITLSRDFCGKIAHRDIGNVSSGVKDLSATRELTFAVTKKTL
ncbi:MAG TPA: ABC transporter substrate-binding protein [Ohtaekwangia sp.]|nr:ABC transporter substrate-binding protein [Ohtaekwangia sp.]